MTVLKKCGEGKEREEEGSLQSLPKRDEDRDR
jgi:hypothetical protein